MPEFPSLAWAKALRDAANADAEFLATCKKYGSDSLILVCEEDASWEETTSLYVAADEGGVHTIEELDSPLDEEADYVISGPYTVWKQALRTEPDDFITLLRGKFRIEGDKEEMLRRVRESMGLLRLIQEVETTFPDEG